MLGCKNIVSIFRKELNTITTFAELGNFLKNTKLDLLDEIINKYFNDMDKNNIIKIYFLKQSILNIFDDNIINNIINFLDHNDMKKILYVNLYFYNLYIKYMKYDKLAYEKQKKYDILFDTKKIIIYFCQEKYNKIYNNNLKGFDKYLYDYLLEKKYYVKSYAIRADDIFIPNDDDIKWSIVYGNETDEYEFEYIEIYEFEYIDNFSNSVSFADNTLYYKSDHGYIENVDNLYITLHIWNKL